LVGREGIEPSTNGLIWLPLSRGRNNYCLSKHRRDKQAR
jgi:hypothetical protein